MGLIAAALKHMLAGRMTPEEIVRAVEDMEASSPVSTARQERNRRYYEKKASEKRLKASEQDVSDDQDASVSPEVPPKDNNQTPLLTPSENHSVACKAHRMLPGYRLSEADRQFARDRGWSESEIDDGEAEHVDYWSNPKLPASKALKTDWSAVWRNRVRDIGKRRGSSAPRAGPRQATQHDHWRNSLRGLGGPEHDQSPNEPEILPPDRQPRNGGSGGPFHEPDRGDPWHDQSVRHPRQLRAV